MIGIIIQARLGSERLPGKMLIPFYESKGLLELLLEKLKLNIPNVPIILATTNNIKDDPLAFLGERLNVMVFRGEENNVLKRFVAAAEKYNIDKIIRICADNPFLDMTYLKKLIEGLGCSTYDYITFKTSNNLPTIKTHYGFWAEGVRLAALKRIEELTSEKVFLEHVTNFIYSNKNLFAQKFINIEKDIEKVDIRLTVDTIDDFNLTKEIYSEISKRNISNSVELVQYISGKPEWVKRMKNQIILNTK